jgi:hypothetical protein
MNGFTLFFGTVTAVEIQLFFVDVVVDDLFPVQRILRDDPVITFLFTSD